MGSTASTAGIGQAQSLLESLAVGPADLPAALQPLLSVSLSEVCAAYQRFGGEDSVCVEDICDQLPLDARAARQLTAGQKCLPTRELLATLVVASRTHAFTKARLIFDLCDFSGEGRLQLEHFFQAVSSFLAAAVRLGSGIRRPVLPRKHVLDSLAFGLFRAYDSEMSKDDFMKMVKSQDHVGRLLRRFARGAYDEAFRIPSWKELAESKTPGSQESEDAANLRREPSRLPQGDLLDAPLPRRRGYFLAVQSSREVALHNELETIQRERASAEKTLHSAIDLEMRERAIREELVTECADEVARREYRRRLQKLWHRSRPVSTLPKKVYTEVFAEQEPDREVMKKAGDFFSAGAPKCALVHLAEEKYTEETAVERPLLQVNDLMDACRHNHLETIAGFNAFKIYQPWLHANRACTFVLLPPKLCHEWDDDIATCVVGSRRIVRADPARLPDGSGWTIGLQMVHSSASVNAVLASSTIHDLVIADDGTRSSLAGRCVELTMPVFTSWAQLGGQ